MKWGKPLGARKYHCFGTGDICLCRWWKRSEVKAWPTEDERGGIVITECCLACAYQLERREAA